MSNMNEVSLRTSIIANDFRYLDRKLGLSILDDVYALKNGDDFCLRGFFSYGPAFDQSYPSFESLVTDSWDPVSSGISMTIDESSSGDNPYVKFTLTCNVTDPVDYSLDISDRFYYRIYISDPSSQLEDHIAASYFDGNENLNGFNAFSRYSGDDSDPVEDYGVRRKLYQGHLEQMRTRVYPIMDNYLTDKGIPAKNWYLYYEDGQNKEGSSNSITFTCKKTSEVWVLVYGPKYQGGSI